MTSYIHDQNELRGLRGGTGRHWPPAGFSMAECVAAMAILGIALSGLFPILVEYSRQVQRLEKCSPQCGRWISSVNSSGRVTWGAFQPRDPQYQYGLLPDAAANQFTYPDNWQLVPADDPWMWKLGAAACAVPNDFNTLTASGGPYVPYLRPFPFNDMARLIADDSNPPTSSQSCLYHGYGTCVDEHGSQSWTTWTVVSGYGYFGSCQRHASSGTPGQPAATWTFTNVRPGWYEVWATWPNPGTGPTPTGDSSPTATAEYQLVDGTGTTIRDVVVTQQNAAAGQQFSDDATNSNWQKIVSKVYLKQQSESGVPADYVSPASSVTDANGHVPVGAYTGDTITVRLLFPPTGTGFITADGLRLVAKPNTITRSTPLTWTWNSQQINTTVTATVTVSTQN
jgi:prepilin-type N-terminal cleavage/methylation domain-containing protein